MISSFKHVLTQLDYDELKNKLELHSVQIELLIHFVQLGMLFEHLSQNL